MKEKRHTLHAYLGLMVEARHYLETSDSRARHRGWVDRYEALRGGNGQLAGGALSLVQVAPTGG